jgi:uncharacterized protein (DUF1499 family)
MRLFGKARLKRPKLWRPILVVCLLLVLIVAMKNPTNSAATRPDHPDAQLRTRVYQASVTEVAAAIDGTVPRLRTYGRSWRVKPMSSLHEAFVVQCEVPVLFFTDDLTVTIHPQDDHTYVDVKSRSRVGRGDFGENRRHILQLLHALDAQLTQK